MGRIAIALGVILIVLGVVAYVTLPIPNSYPILVSGETMTAMAGSSIPRVFHIPVGADVSGVITVVGGGGLDIDFYVFDKNNYDLWNNGQQSVKYVYIYRANSGQQFSFTTDKDADYYFVFSNPLGVFFGGSDRTITWSASYEYKPYASLAVPILVLLVVVGVVIVSGAYFIDLREKMKKLRTCPNCNQRVPIEQAICPHCGFDISKSIRCNYCNTIYDRSLLKCPNCGAKNK